MILPKLAGIPKLKDKAVVTEAMNCPAYAFLLTQKGIGGEASLVLQTQLSEAGGAVGNKLGGHWKCTSTSGVWRTAYGYRVNEKTQQDAVYTLFFMLQTTKPKRKWGFRGSAASSLPAAGKGDE